MTIRRRKNTAAPVPADVWVFIDYLNSDPALYNRDAAFGIWQKNRFAERKTVPLEQQMSITLSLCETRPNDD